jgi:thiamine biosynthesis lipoprotein
MNTLTYHITFRAMGCKVALQLQTRADGEAVLRRVPGQVEALEARLSRFRPESELSRLNRQAGKWVEVSHVLFANVSEARAAAQLTNGLFNPLVLPALRASGYDRSFEMLSQPNVQPAVPVPDWRTIDLDEMLQRVRLPPHSALDLGGIAKGRTAGLIADELSVYGAALVDMGGDIAARGAPEDLPGWLIDVPMPGSDNVVTTVALKDTNIMTSGSDYRRWHTRHGQVYHHIIDPNTGRPAHSDVLSATVIDPHAPTAEASAKAVLLLGSDAGLRWLDEQPGAAGLVIREDGSVSATPRFESFEVEVLAYS